jgi:gamma-glutamyltranspeptidase/glutathione hydrolase
VNRPRAPDADTDLVEPHAPYAVYPQRVAVSREGMVTTAHYRATEAGAQILARGGNAFDAAAAAAFALGVCEPNASGLGGQTMAVIYNADGPRRVALDGSSRAPHRVPPGPMPNDERLRGHRATTVPSTPAVLGYLVSKYGTLSIGDVLQPAIRLASEGYRISELQRSLQRRELKSLRAHTAGRFFLRNGRLAYRVGMLFRQPTLATTLERLAEAGVEDFYQGEIAARIHHDMVRNGGYLRDDDLAQIPWPVERRPLLARYANLRVYTMPPPGAGRTLVEALNVLSNLPQTFVDIDSPRGALMLAEVIRKANVDHAGRPFDPNLHAQHKDEDITESAYAERVARRLQRRVRKAGVTSRGETTHLSVMDAQGNAIALTQSIERVYGSFTVSPDLGFLYNNYMSAFEYEDITHPYYLRPNAVPWGSVAPTIVLRGRRPAMVLGSPGSERIVSSVLQVLLRIIGGTSPFDAVDAPRLHCAFNRRVSLEASRMRDDIPALLERRGFEIDPRDPYSFYLGCVALIVRERGGLLTGVADPRRDGSASGPRS